MKQNERLLVYAVSGFLAIILVVAVVFGPSGREVAGATKDGDSAKGLSEILGQKPAEGDVAGEPKPDTPGSISGLPSPGKVSPEQPLVAGDRTLLAADLVTQQLGPSTRDRIVRIVHARAGDSLESLVRRWCGARDPYLEEAKKLNEDLVVLRVGQPVGVPWVDDEVLLAALEAQKPRTLVPDSLGSVLGDGAQPAAAAADPAALGRPAFAEPGAARTDTGAPAATARSYTVQQGDSLWKIADRTYGRKNAARMVNEIRQANPGLDDRLRVGQKLVLPQPPAGGA